MHKTDDAARTAVSDWPGNRADDIRAGNGTQVGVDLFEFDTVAHDFDLIVDASEAVIVAAGIAQSQIARALPAFAVQGRETPGGEIGSAQIAVGQLASADQ